MVGELRGTKAVLPSGVTATPLGIVPTVMSVGFLVLVFTSIVDTVPLPSLVTKAVGRHRDRAGTADTPSGTTPTSAPANPNTTTRRTDRNRRIAAPACYLLSSRWTDQGIVRRTWALRTGVPTAAKQSNGDARCLRRPYTRRGQ